MMSKDRIVTHYLQDEIDNWRTLGMSETYIVEKLTERYNDAIKFLGMLLEKEIENENQILQ